MLFRDLTPSVGIGARGLNEDRKDKNARLSVGRTHSWSDPDVDIHS